MTRLVDAGLVDADWNAGPTRASSPTRSSSSSSARATPRTSGPGPTWSRPGVQVITPEPVHLGRRAQWNIMAAYGAQIEQRQDRRSRPRIPDAALQERPGAADERPRGPADLRRRQGRRAALLRERGDRRPAAGEDIDYVVPDETILIENPVAGRPRLEASTAAKAFVDFAAAPTPARRSSPTRATARSTTRRVAAEYELPDAAEALHDRRPRRLDGRSTTKFFDPDNGIVTEIVESQGIDR